MFSMLTSCNATALVRRTGEYEIGENISDANITEMLVVSPISEVAIVERAKSRP